MFNKDSAIVQVWVNLINGKDGKYTREQIPNLSNLREVVIARLDG